MPTPEEMAAQEAADALARGDVLPNADEQAEKIAADEAARLAADEARKKSEADEAARLAAEKVAKKEEGEEEGEETAEEKAEREKEEAEKDSKKRIRIPLSRHEAVLENARRREAELQARIQQLEQGAKGQQPQQKDVLAEMKAKIEALQDKYEGHVFEGEKAEAKAARAELERLREQYTDAKMSAVGQAARAQTIESLKYEQALAKVEADYPALNPESDQYDEAKEGEVADLLELFQKNGLQRQAALAKAVKYVMGPPQERKNTPPDTAAQLLAEKRAAEARQKAAEASKRQAPDTSKVGDDSDKKGKAAPTGFDIMKMTQEQFAKMSEEELAKLRGDEIA